MSMDYHDNRERKKSAPFLNSLSYAMAGIVTAVKVERNFQFHLIFAVVVICSSFYFSISKVEWIFILFAIGGMLALELVNSAIERVVDLVTFEYHPLAKLAKDFAAGAVLIYAIVAVAIGLLIFFPRILQLF